MPRELTGGQPMANQDTLASAGTGQLLAAGAQATTFADDTRFIMIMYADKACYIAKTAAHLAAAADGTSDCRVYIPAAASGIVLPWSGKNVYVLNVTGGETPFVAVVGLR